MYDTTSSMKLEGGPETARRVARQEIHNWHNIAPKPPSTNESLCAIPCAWTLEGFSEFGVPFSPVFWSSWTGGERLYEV